MTQPTVTVEGDLTATYRLDVFATMSDAGCGVRVKVLLVGRFDGADAGEVSVFDRTHVFEAGHSGAAMARAYLLHVCPWWALADWLDDNADALRTLPAFLRPRVGLAFREYHEQRQPHPRADTHSTNTI